MGPLYNNGIRLYALAAKMVAMRSPKVKRMIQGQGETLERIREWRAANDGARFDVWFHAASLGEFEQARPLIEKLRREQPERRILLSFFSPSGYEVRKNYDQVDLVVYLPFDRPHKVANFLEAADPGMAVFVKYEFWGNFLQQLQRRGVPTYIIDSIFRPKQRFFKPYGGVFRGMLRCFTRLYVQDENSRQLLAGVGVDNVTVAGDTRFDRVTDVMRTRVDFPMIEKWLATKNSKVLIVGSSWEKDEDCYIPYLNAHPKLRAIIAPHEFNAERLARLQGLLKHRSMLLSEAEHRRSIPANTQVLIIDSFGKLSSLYRYGNVAIIGGGFGAGIHNINEAAVYGIPVIFGPNHFKFKEAADLIEAGGGFEYDSQEKLKEILDGFFGANGDQRRKQAGKIAGEYIQTHLGATEQIYNDLFTNEK
ncbi:MAG: 3-deoxy-D-manno-octulosonic acid transferase [Bacteroidales bacterium]|nr:3-deoxy-D-manno-octulosonic acid transferase [Bacteroidales bacterium]